MLESVWCGKRLTAHQVFFVLLAVMNRPADRDNDLVERFRHAGQEHVFRFWHRLSDAERQNLLAQLRTLDIAQLDDAIARYRAGAAPGVGGMEPVKPSAPDDAECCRAQRLGEELLRRGKVAALVVAGGQGTRLGFDAPKGIFPIGPISRKSLFQIHAEKLLAASRRYGAPIPWYIMTSPATHEATIAFFREQRFFGLSERDVIFFQQGLVPALDFEGRLILEAPDRISMNPNGHGGVIYALEESGALEDMRHRGVEMLSYFQVDNPLVQIIDPVFLGMHTDAGAGMSCKVLRKRDAEEKLGVVCRINGTLHVVEYIDLPAEKMHARQPDGSLVFDAGSIAIHVLSVDFLRRLNAEGVRLPLHFSKKKIPHIDSEGRPVEPAEPNGIKMEMFVFDALPLSPNPVILETRREEEFSPVKNVTGEDSPATAQQAMSDFFGRWLEAAGVSVPRDAAGHVQGRIEIGPLYALDAAELRSKLPRPMRFTGELYLDESISSAHCR